jgi:hypothetical protein
LQSKIDVVDKIVRSQRAEASILCMLLSSQLYNFRDKKNRQIGTGPYYMVRSVHKVSRICLLPKAKSA